MPKSFPRQKLPKRLEMLPQSEQGCCQSLTSEKCMQCLIAAAHQGTKWLQHGFGIPSKHMWKYLNVMFVMLWLLGLIPYQHRICNHFVFPQTLAIEFVIIICAKGCKLETISILLGISNWPIWAQRVSIYRWVGRSVFDGTEFAGAQVLHVLGHAPSALCDKA